MRVVFLLTFFMMYLSAFGQESIKGFVGLSQNSDYNFTISETSLKFGVKFNNSFTSISILGVYAYGGVFNYNSLFNHHKNFAAYQLDYHLIGGGIKLRMRNTEKLYSPTLKFTFLTEITSKYRGGKIIASGSESKDVNFSPTDHIYEIKKPLYGGSGGPIIFQNYRSYHYISTPLVGSFFFGNEFEITDNLYLNIGIGYLLRAFRFYKNEWKLDETEPNVKITNTHKLKETKYGKVETDGYLVFELGINYTFSFKAKNK